MSLRFGTDGIRGVANIDLTPEFALRLGRALAASIPPGPVLIARDSRLSGEMLEGALLAGLLSAGRSVLSAGILPTPALALLTRMSEAVLGVMISASHNPIEDNGFKCFDALGFKLADEIERSIEDELLRDPGPPPLPGSHPTLRRDTSLVDLYIDAITSLGVALNSYTVVIDAAFGAAYAAAPEAFRALGARVVMINGEADGARINVRCGATDLRMLAEEVRRIGGSRTVGVAFDGDADRVRFVDERGEPVDGDAILLVMARDLKERGALAGDVVIGTLMSNAAFERRLEEEGMRLLRTPVGDRYVLQAMRECGANFGGEPSGHIIDLRRNTTGDGPAAAIALLSLLARKETTLSALVADYEPYPQILLNVPLPLSRGVVEHRGVHEDPRIVAAVAAARALLGGEGRVLIRPSGTEPLTRVMVEGRDAKQIRAIAEDFAEMIRAL